MARFKHLNITQAEPLLSPQELLQELPLSSTQQKFIETQRQAIRQILDGQDSRLLLIVGPCSIHDIASAKEYAYKLQQLSERTSDTFCIIMRAFFEKPRTTLGWKGLFYDPHLDGSSDIVTGLRWTRKLLLDLTDMQIATAAEFLDPISPYCFGDLVTWGCIGARTASSPVHRHLASALPMPIAFKNTTDGNVDIAIKGVITASAPHTFIGMDAHGRLSALKTTGNTHGHIVLRGREGKPNFDAESVSRALARLQQAELPLRLLIDCSHDNSMRQHEQQVHVFQSVIRQIVEGNHSIRGILLESHLEAGNQPFHHKPEQLKYAVSLTDPCLDWSTTEQLLLWGHKTLAEAKHLL